MTSNRHRRTNQGSVTLELVILTPALITALLFVIAAGQITTAHSAVEAAARDAARQASISRDPTTARNAAQNSAQATLTREGLACPALVSIDTSGFSQALGQTGTVTAQVTCHVNVADLAVVGIGGITVSARFASPIDPFRGRQP